MCADRGPSGIETERLVLRAPRPEDATRIALLINDVDIARMLSPIPHPYTIEDGRSFLAEAEAAGPARQRPLAIELPGEGLVGMTGFSKRGLFWETGYWLGRAFWGRGLATESCRGALDWGFGVLGLRAVMSSHFADNPASARVLHKAGFLYTGEVQRRFCVARGEPVDTRMMVRLA